MTTLLPMEDDPRVSGFLKRGLEAEGYAVSLAETGGAALALARAHDLPLILLDRMVPDGDGMEVSRLLRAEGRGGRILMLTAKDALRDKVDGLRAGADGCLTKPFSFEEILARVEALLRRGPLRAEAPELRAGDLVLDPERRTVARGGHPVALSAKAFALLRLPMDNAAAVVSRARILSEVWGYGFDPGTNVVDVHVL